MNAFATPALAIQAAAAMASSWKQREEARHDVKIDRITIDIELHPIDPKETGMTTDQAWYARVRGYVGEKTYFDVAEMPATQYTTF